MLLVLAIIIVLWGAVTNVWPYPVVFEATVFGAVFSFDRVWGILSGGLKHLPLLVNCVAVLKGLAAVLAAWRRA